MEKIIANAYYDLGGFSNLHEHLKDTKKKDKSITLEDVKIWRNQNIEQTKNLKGYNSFVADKPYEEFQMDLAFFDMKDPVYIGALVMIDIFTKYATAVPFKTKQPDELLKCIKEGMHKMGGKPGTFYTDNEGSFLSKDIQKYFTENDIRHLTTNSHAGVVERFIRTLKNMINDRVKYYKKPWYEFLFPSLLTYNNKSVHSTTKHTPNEARKNKNEFNVKLNLLLHKKHDRLYPPLNVGDNVKIYKKKHTFDKESKSVWTANVYEIENIEDSLGQNVYKIKGMPKVYLRHELLKL
jgi:hypothetical protein